MPDVPVNRVSKKALTTDKANNSYTLIWACKTCSSFIMPNLNLCFALMEESAMSSLHEKSHIMGGGGHVKVLMG